MKKSFYFIPLILLLYSCTNISTCKKIEMSADDLSWIKFYNLNDKVVLINTKNEDKDTLKLIEKIVEFSPCNKFELGPNQYQQYYYTFLSSKFNSPGSLTSTAGLSYYTGKNRYGNDKKTIDAFGRIWVTDNLEQDILKRKIKVVGLKDSIETLYLDKTNFPSQGKSRIKSFNWHKKLGLVRYVTNDGNIYEFQRKL